jgi:hypothetical protein
LSLKGKNKLIVFEKRVVRNILGCDMAERIGNCRRFHTEDLHDLTPEILSTDQVKKGEMGGVCGTHGERRNT